MVPIDETRATAHLPFLDLEIVLTRPEDDAWEQVSVTLRRTPGRGAWDPLAALASPAAAPMAAWLAFSPFGLWLRWAQAMGSLAGPRPLPPAGPGAA